MERDKNDMVHASGNKERPESGLKMADLITLLHDLVYILAAAAIVFGFFGRVVTVDGDSMLPTLKDREHVILLNNLPYGEPQRGDIVVARIPAFSSELIVKRVIAVQGDVVDIDFAAGTVSVNGQILQEDYVRGATTIHFGMEGVAFPLTVEEGCVFLLGDNREDSYDSRYAPIGQVDTRYILGKVIFY